MNEPTVYDNERKLRCDHVGPCDYQSFHWKNTGEWKLIKVSGCSYCSFCRGTVRMITIMDNEIKKLEELH